MLRASSTSSTSFGSSPFDSFAAFSTLCRRAIAAYPKAPSTAAGAVPIARQGNDGNGGDDNGVLAKGHRRQRRHRHRRNMSKLYEIVTKHTMKTSKIMKGPVKISETYRAALLRPTSGTGALTALNCAQGQCPCTNLMSKRYGQLCSLSFPVHDLTLSSWSNVH